MIFEKCHFFCAKACMKKPVRVWVSPAPVQTKQKGVFVSMRVQSIFNPHPSCYQRRTN